MTARARTVATTVAVLLLFALPLIPEIVGSRRLIFRDAAVTHWPWRRAAMAALEAGRVPFVNEGASGGEPLLANPNAVLLYPTVLLECVVSPASAFNLHYLLSVVWAFLGARLLASRLGASSGAAMFSAAAYAFSGMMLSYASAFANSGPAAAWLPWCAAAALGVVRAREAREAARGAAATGLAFGLQLYAGEPAISLLTGLFTAVLAVSEIFGLPREERGRGLARGALGGIVAAGIAAAFAAALLLPLRAVFPLTYRGQHLYSERAFGAAPFHLPRVLEWVFPRLSGDPTYVSARTGGFGETEADFIYVWCVTLGVFPLLAILAAAVKRRSWDRRALVLAGTGLAAWLFSFGLSLPFARLVFAVPFLRRLRYPIKFYLLTTIAAALLAGLAFDRSREPGEPPRRRLAIGLFAGALLLAAAAVAMPAFRAPTSLVSADALRGDLLLAAVSLAIFAALSLARRFERLGHALALLTTAFALPWMLPLFVSGSVKDLSRPPAVLSALKGPGRVYVSSRLPAPKLEEIDPGRPNLPRYEKFVRVVTESLLPSTGQSFGVEYSLDHDPDGSYGWYNRLANEAADASPPADRARLLRAYGTRWVLAADGDAFPGFHPVTGLIVGGRNLVLHKADDPVADVRWAPAAREFRRRSLSSAISLVRSDRFAPETDVVLPGREDRDPPAGAGASATPAVVSLSRLTPEGVKGTLESPADGYVVFGRTYFPSWRASVDGRPARTLVANARDVAVALPSGRHEFEIDWDRTPFHRGVALQGAALLAALAVGAATGRAR
jgi:hypothetical protein